MANLKNLQGRKFDPVRFEAAVQKVRREFAARTGEPLLEAPDDLSELPELPEQDDEVVVTEAGQPLVLRPAPDET